MRGWMFAALAGLALSQWSTEAYAQTTEPIEWRLNDRFRFFGDASDDLLRPVYEQAQRSAHPDQRADWVSFNWTLFARVACEAMVHDIDGAETYCARREELGEADSAFIQSVHEQARRRTHVFAWDRVRGQYDAGYLTPRSYELEVSLRGARTGETCTWTAWAVEEYRNARNQQALRDISPPSSVVGSCAGQALHVPVARDPSTTASYYHARVQVQRGRGAPVQQHIKIEDVLIVGVGDSFASGEGNPDIPTNWAPLATRWGELHRRRGDTGASWFATQAAAESAAGAVWLDETCHRSLMSWPAVTAMAMAAENDRRAITFMSFACGGASTFDGFLLPHLHAPGGLTYEFVTDEGDSFVRQFAPDGSRAEGIPWRSQIDALAFQLCDLREDNIRRTPVEVYLRVEQYGDWREGVSAAWGSSEEYYQARQHRVRQCTANRRPVDRLLIALGGNDVSFAEAIVWSFAPRRARSFFGNLFADGVNNANQSRVCIEYGQDGCVLPRRYRTDGPVPVSYYGEPSDNFADYRCLDGVRTAPRHRPPANYLVRCFLPEALEQARTAIFAQGIARDRVSWIAYPSEFWRYPASPGELPSGVGMNTSAPADADLANRDPRLCGEGLNSHDDSDALIALQAASDGAVRVALPRSWFFGEGRFYRAWRSESASVVRNLYDPLNDEVRRAIGSRRVLDNHLGGPSLANADNPHPLPGASDHFPDGDVTGAALGDVRRMPAEWRGWCADYRAPDDRIGHSPSPFAFPTTDERRIGLWTDDAPPWAWRAYGQRSRLFRTPNDSLLTQFPGPSESAEGLGFNAMKRRILDGFGGMMHPTAEMHAIMANQAVRTIQTESAGPP
jgi:hypothetical protein